MLLDKFEKEVVANSHKNDLNISAINDVGKLNVTIERVVKEYEIDIVVMGTKRLKGFEDILLGSHTYNVIQAIKCPVFIIPENIEYTAIENFVFASDLKKIDDNIVLSPLLSLMTGKKAKFEIITVTEGGRIKNEEDEIEILKLKNYFDQFEPNFHTIEHDDVSVGIQTSVTKANGTILVLLSRNNGFFDLVFNRSVTKQITLRTSYPTLVLPDK